MTESVSLDSGSLISGLPPSHLVHHFTHFSDLEADAGKALQSLQARGDGNQYIFLSNMSARVREKLDNDHKRCLGGIDYRFQWEGTNGLIKVVPSQNHNVATDMLVRKVDQMHYSMGLPFESSVWPRTTTFTSGPGRGKQADDCFLPASRAQENSTPDKWPTLVVETGVSESLPRLREDAREWFRISEGKIRMVILISIRPTNIVYEKWQLAPLNAPVPLTRSYINTLRARRPNLPPTALHPRHLQHAYCAQEIFVSNNRVDGAPLVLPFSTLHDRQAHWPEHDIVISGSDFAEFFRLLR